MSFSMIMKSTQVFVGLALAITTISAYPYPSEDTEVHGQPMNITEVTATLPPDDDEMSCLHQRAREAKNKETVLALFKGVFHDYDTNVVEKYVHPTTYIQHNPFLADGVENLRECIIDWGKGREKEPLDIKRTSGEGNFVWVQHKVRGKFSKDVAAIHLYRLEDGKVVEHWDQFQPIPDLADSKNPHPFF